MIRPLSDDETPLLAQAVLGNINWCGPRFTLADVSRQPEFAHYTALVSERGDFGFVAVREEESTGRTEGVEDARKTGEAVGVVWAQHFSAEQPGFGFVDEAVPELSVWVREGYRGRGIGRALLRALKAEATGRGVRRVSLSVEADNGARQLYEAEGFVAVPGREVDGVMLWEATAEGSS